MHSMLSKMSPFLLNPHFNLIHFSLGLMCQEVMTCQKEMNLSTRTHLTGCDSLDAFSECDSVDGLCLMIIAFSLYL